MSMTKIALAAAMAAVCGSAMADGFYIGGSLGQSYSNFKTADYSLGMAAVTESQDKTDLGYKVFAGYNLLPSLAVEGGYANLGKPKYNYTGTGVLAGINAQASTKETSWFMAAKGTYNLNEQIGLFAKVGVAFNRAEVTVNSNNAAFNTAIGAPLTISKNSTAPLLGIGAEYNVTKQFGIRAELESYGRFGDAQNTGRTQASMWSIGATYKF